MTLPILKWTPSPNFNSRQGTRVDQIIIHDMEGTYAGSIAYFQTKKSQVSAHFCVREDGGDITQMIHLSDRAWHACAANSRSVGIEMAGYAKNGFRPELIATTAALAAELCHYLQIPVRHARGGVGPGIESHWGLGKAGGGHSDPSTDPAWMDRFVDMMMIEYGKGFDPNYFDLSKCSACKLRPPEETPKSGVAHAPPIIDPTDPGAGKGLQLALNASGAPPPLVIDGVIGSPTRAAIASF
jgi:hypothetical protein